MTGTRRRHDGSGPVSRKHRTEHKQHDKRHEGRCERIAEDFLDEREHKGNVIVGRRAVRTGVHVEVAFDVYRGRMHVRRIGDVEDAKAQLQHLGEQDRHNRKPKNHGFLHVFKRRTMPSKIPKAQPEQSEAHALDASIMASAAVANSA